MKLRDEVPLPCLCTHSFLPFGFGDAEEHNAFLGQIETFLFSSSSSFSTVFLVLWKNYECFRALLREVFLGMKETYSLKQY